jgi:DNA (cytosine-5)-methyltransferase 1
MSDVKPLRLEDARKNKSFTFIDLFAGIGGTRLAFDAAGGKCVFTSEWDKNAQKTYQANFGGEPIHGDITQIAASDIPDHDVLIGGFPCQPFSLAGVSKKNSLGRAHGFLDETQGTLFFDIVRILKEKRPAAFFLENVRNIKSHDSGNTFRIIEGALRELGYSFQWKLVDASYYVPQNRLRVYMVGYDVGINRPDPLFRFPQYPETDKPCLRDILEKRVPKKYVLSDNLWEYLQNYADKHAAAGNGFGYGLSDLNGASRTLSARYYKDGAEILIPRRSGNPRRLTPRECARLQGFPDSFVIPVGDSAAYKQFGNSVAVPAVRAVADSMHPYITEIKRYRCLFPER